MLMVKHIPTIDQTATDHTDHTMDVDGKTFPQQTKQPQNRPDQSMDVENVHYLICLLP